MAAEICGLHSSPDWRQDGASTGTSNPGLRSALPRALSPWLGQEPAGRWLKTRFEVVRENSGFLLLLRKPNGLSWLAPEDGSRRRAEPCQEVSDTNRCTGTCSIQGQPQAGSPDNTTGLNQPRGTGQPLQGPAW